MKRAQHLGGQNTYTCLRKAVGESSWRSGPRSFHRPSLRPRSFEIPSARPSPVGNEGINTFRPAFVSTRHEFPAAFLSKERKCLDMIPVDMVTRGMTLIAAALVERKHAASTTGHLRHQSVNMARSIELTA